ncbi:MAG: hypothetical protein L2C94_000600 [Aigarchaeota archaeon]|nr:hypothetical protein [Candidatus Wolframiiraptor gerlachensis]
MRRYAGSVAGSAFNEYGDSAYLSEDMMETRSPVRSIWPGDVVILEGG